MSLLGGMRLAFVARRLPTAVSARRLLAWSPPRMFHTFGTSNLRTYDLSQRRAPSLPLFRSLSDAPRAPSGSTAQPVEEQEQVWQLVKDKASGGEYWWCQEDGQTTTLGAARPMAWREVVDEATGQSFWWSQEDGHTTALGAARPKWDEVIEQAPLQTDAEDKHNTYNTDNARDNQNPSDSDSKAQLPAKASVLSRFGTVGAFLALAAGKTKYIFVALKLTKVSATSNTTEHTQPTKSSNPSKATLRSQLPHEAF